MSNGGEEVKVRHSRIRYGLCGCWIVILLLPVPVLAAQALGAPADRVPTVIRVWGSPQMGDLLHRYEEGFHKLHPNVRFEEDLKSTATAVAGVYAGRADIGLLGREIWPEEVQAFQSVTGWPPRVIEVAMGSYDVPKATFALMIFVHRSNPLASLSTEQLARVFGIMPPGTEHRSDDRSIETWGDLGLTGSWAARPVHLYGFSLENDKARIFRERIFEKGERWNCGLREFSNASGPNGPDAGELIVRAVADDPDGIGLSNVHYATRGVHALALSTTQHTTPIQPTRENVASNLYPLARTVSMVANASAGAEPSVTTLQFLRFVLSEEGIAVVRQKGDYLPLTKAMAAEQRRKLGDR